MVLEALASGLPVIGLDAEGTRDLVTHEQTGLLLPLPAELSVAVSGGKNTHKNAWPAVCRDQSNPLFISCAERYAALLSRATCNHAEREVMGARASTEGIEGYTWWDAMEVSRNICPPHSSIRRYADQQKCVDWYRESLRMAREKRKVSVVTHTPSSLLDEEDQGYTPASSPVGQTIPLPSSPPSRISRVNRVVSRRLAHKGAWAPHGPTDDTRSHASESTDVRAGRRFGVRRAKVDTSETIWHLSEWQASTQHCIEGVKRIEADNVRDASQAHSCHCPFLWCVQPPRGQQERYHCSRKAGGINSSTFSQRGVSACVAPSSYCTIPSIGRTLVDVARIYMYFMCFGSRMRHGSGRTVAKGYARNA